MFTGVNNEREREKERENDVYLYPYTHYVEARLVSDKAIKNKQ